MDWEYWSLKRKHHDPEFDDPRPPMGIAGAVMWMAVLIGGAAFWYKLGSWLKAWILS